MHPSASSLDVTAANLGSKIEFRGQPSAKTQDFYRKKSKELGTVNVGELG